MLFYLDSADFFENNFLNGWFKFYPAYEPILKLYNSYCLKTGFDWQSCCDYFASPDL